MNCSECEQLFDAYLDGQLAGSLRLEFDAHRLRCRRCQQTLAMLEAAGHVISSDSETPDLPEDFADRVMRHIERPKTWGIRFPLTRAAIVTGAVLQAAAVLTIAILWNAPPADRAEPGSGAGYIDYEDVGPDGDPGFVAIRDLVVEGVEDHLWEMQLAGRQLTTDVVSLARYLDIMLPDDVAHESSKLARRNPLDFILDFGAGEEEEPEPASPTDDIHSI